VPADTRNRFGFPIKALSYLGSGFDAFRVVGLSSSLWYGLYTAQLRSGWTRKRLPVRTWDQVVQNTLRTGAQGSIPSPRFFFLSPQALKPAILQASPDCERLLQSEMDAMTAGRFRLWSGFLRDVGFPPRWNTNVLTGKVQPVDAHWTEVVEQASGDVKGLWELSRFSFVFPLVRGFAVSGEPRAAEIFWTTVESWLEANPPQMGAQWLSAQEAALRAMAWIFGLRGLAGAEPADSPRTIRLLAALGEHARRIEATLAYARAQNNNHLIAEAAGLYTIGLCFPQLPGAGRWKKTGRSLLCQAAGQFFTDGGYIQHSHNYHRLALELYLWAFQLGALNADPFPEATQNRIQKSLAYFSGLLDVESGRLPNFGHNDGARFLPLSDCPYDDYRPVLQALAIQAGGERLFGPGPWDEEALWLFRPDAFQHAGSSPPRQTNAKPISAGKAGLHVLEGKSSKVVIRCGRFTERPAHADQLHVDLWLRGQEIACDAGSYLYSGDPPWQNALAHAAVHNTVTVDGRDQMERSGRFRWTTLAQGQAQPRGDACWTGSHEGYRRLGLTHSRSVERTGSDNWIVSDTLAGTGRHTARLHWLTPDMPWVRLQPEVESFREKLPPEWRKSAWAMAPGNLICVKLNTPSMPIRLWIQSSHRMEISIYRGGLHVGGEEDKASIIPVENRGWRSLRYAEKFPALSLAVSVTATSPIAFLSFWDLDGEAGKEGRA
jgi:hypothetical protein